MVLLTWSRQFQPFMWNALGNASIFRRLHTDDSRNVYMLWGFKNHSHVVEHKIKLNSLCWSDDVFNAQFSEFNDTTKCTDWTLKHTHTRCFARPLRLSIVIFTLVFYSLDDVGTFTACTQIYTTNKCSALFIGQLDFVLCFCLFEPHSIRAYIIFYLCTFYQRL